MRRVTHGDAISAARVLLRVPGRRREWVLARMLREAGRADKWVRATGRAHPLWGDGSLMAAALRRQPVSEPSLDDAGYCLCLSLVFFALAWRAR